MSRAASRLTVHFGERGRSAEAPLAEALFSCLADHGIRDAILLRGGEGFGPRHGLQSSSRLSLSEDLPMVLVSVGESKAIEQAAFAARLLLDEGLVAFERVRLLEEDAAEAGGRPSALDRITVWLNRGARIDGSPAYELLTAAFHEHGAEAAIALLGVDGLVAGLRRRAGFFSANREVPMQISAVGPHPGLVRAWRGLSGRLPGAFAEASGVNAPGEGMPPAQSDACGTEATVRVSVFEGGLRPGAGVDSQRLLVRRLRRAGASGATALQGVFGFSGGQQPHGESFRTLRRRIPVLTELIDTPGRSALWLAEAGAAAGPDAMIVAQPVARVNRPDDPA